MVTGLVRVSALNRKLLRDLWEMKGQALAIAAVIAAGVTMFVTYLSNFDSLERTLQNYQLKLAAAINLTGGARTSAKAEA